MKPIRGAVVDLGSNSFKLLLAEQRGKTLYVHHEEAIVTRLAESVAIDRKLQSQAIHRSLTVLEAYVERISAFNPARIAITGTSALRSARNRDLFLKPACELLASPIHIISGRLEAELIYAGIVSYSQWRKSTILDIDLGGGSVEMVEGSQGRVKYAKSLPLGCVRLRDLFFKTWPAQRPERLRVLREAAFYLYQHLHFIERKWSAFDGKVLISGGTADLLCRVVLDCLDQKPTQVPEGFWLHRSVFDQLFESFCAMSHKDLLTLPSVPKERADLVIPGLTFYLVLLNLLKAKEVYFTLRGLRYGAWSRWICSEPFSDIQRV